MGLDSRQPPGSSSPAGELREEVEGNGQRRQVAHPTGEGVEGLQKHPLCAVGRDGLGVQLNGWTVWL